MEKGSDDCVWSRTLDETAYATIKGLEVMRMIRRRHCILIEPGVTGEARFVSKLFRSRCLNLRCGASQILSDRR